MRAGVIAVRLTPKLSRRAFSVSHSVRASFLVAKNSWRRLPVDESSAGTLTHQGRSRPETFEGSSVADRAIYEVKPRVADSHAKLCDFAPLYVFLCSYLPRQQALT